MADGTPLRSTRDLILDATDRLMALRGFRKTTVDDIAKEAAVARRTIYTYFPNKEELGLASIARVVETVISGIDTLSMGDGGPEARLRAMLIERVMGRVRAVQDYHQSLDDLFEVVRPSYMARRRGFFEREANLIAGVLESGVAANVFRMSEPLQTAEILLLATNAFLPYSLTVREIGHPEEIEERLASMVDILIRGLVT